MDCPTRNGARGPKMNAIARGFLLLGLLFGGVVSGEVHGAESAEVEKWADRRLQVTRGLAVWLDAARLAEARAAGGEPPLQEGDALAQWPDASGRKRHLTQTNKTAQPT